MVAFQRVVGLSVDLILIAIPPRHTTGVGAEAAFLSANGPCFNPFTAGGACVFLLFQRMSVNIRADRGEGKLKLFSDRRGVCALPPHPVQLGFLMVGHEVSSFLKYISCNVHFFVLRFWGQKKPPRAVRPERLEGAQNDTDSFCMNGLYSSYGALSTVG